MNNTTESAAMTDHKAEHVAVLRELRDAPIDAYYVPTKAERAALDAAIAALTAAPAASEAQAAADDLVIYGTAIMLDGKRIDPRTVQIDPAASEGEDGAKKYRCERARVVGFWNHDCAECLQRVAENTIGTRPAAQVAATPKHDEGRDAYAILTEYAAAIGDDHDVGICNCDILRARDALATQPAARRVTDPYVRIAHLIGSIFFAGQFKAETHNERELEALLIATGHRYKSWDEVESFAQPAEGVSGG